MPPLLTSTTRPPATPLESGPRSASVITTGPTQVHRHAELEALRRLGALGRHHARVVHHRVEVGDLGGEAGREASYVVEVGHVAPPQPQLRAGVRGADPVGDPGPLGLVAHEEVHDRAEVGQPRDRRGARARSWRR